MTLAVSLMVSMAGKFESKTLAANPDSNYGWQVWVMTLTANPDGIYGWQVESRPLLPTLMVTMAGRFGS